MKRVVWDPTQYERFAAERLRPAIELLARVPLEAPSLICDLGCGTGKPTLELRRRWPEARIIAVDRSVQMLAKARLSDASIEWVEGDLVAWRSPRPLDLIFSNAALHWVADHERLLPDLMGWLAPGGVLAVQLPANFEGPSHQAMVEVARLPRWDGRLDDVTDWPNLLPVEEYVDLLAPLTGSLDIWETTYHHVLTGDDPIVEFFKGTALRPFLSRLEPAERETFQDEYRCRIADACPRRGDGTTILPFRRLFIVAARDRD